MVSYLPLTAGQCPPGYGLYPSESPLGPAGCYAPNGIQTEVSQFLPGIPIPEAGPPDIPFFPPSPCDIFPEICAPPTIPYPFPPIGPFAPDILPAPRPTVTTTMRMPGSISFDMKGRCTVTTVRPAGVYRRKATPVFNPVTGQIIGCTPVPRRLNPLNPSALKRALRRACAFEKFARRAIKVTSAGWKKGYRRKGCVPARRKTCQV